MIKLEQKVDLIMRYIATDDKKLKKEFKNRIIEALTEDTSEEPKTFITVDDLIYELFKELGIQHRLRGYNQAVYAVKLMLTDPTYSYGICKRLYPDIAAQYGTTPARVERNIRQAIEVAFDHVDMDELVNLIGNTVTMDKAKLTNKEFIIFCADEISRRIKKLDVVA